MIGVMNKTQEVTQRWIDYAKDFSFERKKKIAMVGMIATINFRWDHGEERLSAVLAALVDNMEKAAGFDANAEAAKELNIWDMREDGSLFLEALRLFDEAVPDDEHSPASSRYRKELIRAMKKGAKYAAQSQTQSS